MWIERDFRISVAAGLPVKVLKGPRQVGKTSILHRLLPEHEVIYFDDLATRSLGLENPALLIGQLPSKLILDEAHLAPPVFFELKRRVDEERRADRKELDIWITSSNQTLLRKDVSESLAGRASLFDLNTLSIHELGALYSLGEFLFKGGWPELYADSALKPNRYLNDLISTFIEKDIVSAAGIGKRAELLQALRLVAGRVGQLFELTDIARAVGVESSTVRSWLSLLEQNGILRELRPYPSNLNKRLLKSPKWYFEDTGLATRFQGWTELEPLMLSPLFGALLENMAVGEVSRFFMNRGERPEIYFLRSKEKVEIDLLVQLPNNRFVALEVKSSPQRLSPEQNKLLDSLNIDIVFRGVVTPSPGPGSVSITELWELLDSHWREAQPSCVTALPKLL
jgi:predicted AAA+ superfamily ATPase